jgi:NADP-dependent 3-hydroxy acid dehydrogenase YdfG
MDQMIDVNARGVLHGIAAGLPVFKQQGFGQFVNVSSIGGHQVYPTAAVYCATKFAGRAISEGLRQEATDVRVTPTPRRSLPSAPRSRPIARAGGAGGRSTRW